MISMLMFIGIDGGNLGDKVIKGLAVVGAAVIGGLGSGLVLRLLSRALVYRAPPRFALIVVRLLGTIAVGLTAGLFLFQDGSGGLGGGGGGWWPFGQGGAGGGAAQPNSSSSQISHEEPEGKPDDSITVRMLGGEEAERDQRFYKIEGQAPMTFKELQDTLQQRRSQTPALQVVVIVISGKSVDAGSPAVLRLKDWLEKHRFEPKMSGP